MIFIIIKKIEKRKIESKAKDFHLVLFLDVKKKNPCISWSFTMSCTIKGLFENSEMVLWGPPPTRGREVSFRWWRVGGCGPHGREREHSSQRTRQCCSLLAGYASFDLPLCSPKLLKVPVWGPVWPESCHGNNRLFKRPEKASSLTLALYRDANNMLKIKMLVAEAQLAVQEFCPLDCRRTQEPVDESERGEWKSWLKTQHSEN